MENEQLFSNQSFKESGIQPQQSSSGNNKLFVIIITSILFTATITGLVVCFWQKSAREKAISGLEQKISSLEKQISTMKRVGTTPQPTSTPPSSLTPTSHSDSEDTASWKTYTNTKYNYSVKYPNDLMPKEEPAANGFLIRTNFWDMVNDTAVFGIEIRKASLTEAVEGVKDDYQKMSVTWELQREDKIVHQGYDGYRLEYESEATVGINVLIMINNGAYSYLICSDKHIVDQILSTFRFTN